MILLKDCNLFGEIVNIGIENKYIQYIGKDYIPTDSEIEVDGKIVIPGIVDTHVHFRDLSQSNKEDWTSGSNAALSGGVTTVFDMPNNIPPIINEDNLNLKRTASLKSLINKYFYIAATRQNYDNIEKILNKKPKDIIGIKLFLSGSNNNEVVENMDYIQTLFLLANKYDKVITIHTELKDVIEKETLNIKDKSIFTHNKIRSREASILGTKLMIAIALKTKTKTVIAHTSTFEEIEMIRQAKKKCSNIFCEITPHHLLLNESILKKVENKAKVNPPLRTAKDNEAIWEAIIDGTSDFIGTDHAPHLLSEKQLSYTNAPAGFPGIETSLPLLFTAFTEHGLSLKKLSELLSSNACRIFNIKKTGEIKENYFADLCILDDSLTYKIDPNIFKTKAKYSPFEGFEVKGKVLLTFVKGKEYCFF